MKYSVQQYAKTFADMLEGASKNEQSKVIKDFTSLLEKNGDIKNSDEIVYAVEKYLYEKDKSVKMEVTEVKESKLHLPHEINHKKVSVTQHSDPSLVGGIKIKIGDVVVDNSLRSRLSELSNIFK